MKILLDTTYLLPLIGVSVEGIPDDASLKLINKGYKVHISNITPFELAAKGAKHVAQGKLPVERVLMGMNALVYDDRIGKIEFINTDILTLAFKLRLKMEDFIDCLILSTALHCCDVLLTEDEDLHKLRESAWFKELKEGVNPNAGIMGFREFAKRYL